MVTRANTNTRLGLIPILIALLLNLIIGPFSPVLDDVSAAPSTVVDEQGPNDEPGQKDLTRLVIDYASLPTSVDVSWNWDEVSWSGANTGDGCALFDTNDNLNVDAAICVTISGDPATLLDVRLYECTQDAKVDRCTGPTEVSASLTSTCSVAQTGTDPFPAGAEYPTDTTASCTIALADIVAGTAELVNVCSYPSEEPNSDPSDCVLIIRDGALQVTKVVTNDNGGTATCADFGFTINPGAVSETFESDCTNLVAVAPGTYSVTEPAVSGYATTYSNCTNVVVDSGETETCTITNNDQASTLTVTKVVTNDNGGSASCGDFSFQVNGGSAVQFESDCSNTISVNAGSYSVTEPAVAGYATSYANSLNANANCTSLAIGNGGSATCTITNNDQQGSLTVTKVVTNDNGGSASCGDFSFQVNGGSAVQFESDCSNTISVNAGSYSVTEPSVTGYATTYANSLNASLNCSSLTVGNGGSATCTITNDDQQGGLTVTKVVTNDDGGDATCDDFSFKINDGAPITFESDCSNTVAVDAGTYSVTEPSVTGYTTTYSNSLNASLNCSSLAIGSGGSATCTITNDDQPGTLTVTKIVSGGDADCGDFSFQVNGGSAIPFEADCSNSLTVDAGTYSVTEPSVSGYTATYSNCTAVAIDNGGSATCTITNTRDTGDLTVIKDLNPVGDPGLFNLQIDGITEAANVGDGGTTDAVEVETGSRNVGETAGTGTALSNYASSIECVDDGGEGDVVASGSGAGPLAVNVTKDADIVCIITNTAVDVGIVKQHDEADGAVESGDVVHYTITVSVNTGSATNVVVTDTLPSGLTYVAGTALPLAGFSASGQKLTWDVGTLSAGDHEFSYDARVDSDASGTLTNRACVDADQNPAQACWQTSLRVPRLVIDKLASTETITISGPASALVATPSVVTWTLSYTLTNGPTTNAVITDVIPTGFAYVAGSASNGGSFNSGTNSLTWTFATLSASGSVSFQTTVNPSTISRAGPTVNTATIVSEDTAPDQGQDSVTVAVIPPPLAGTPPPLPNTAIGIGPDGTPVSVPIELLAALFIGSLGALALANTKARSRRR